MKYFPDLSSSIHSNHENSFSTETQWIAKPTPSRIKHLTKAPKQKECHMFNKCSRITNKPFHLYTFNAIQTLTKLQGLTIQYQ